MVNSSQRQRLAAIVKQWQVCKWVSPEANPGCHIKVIPHEIACGNMGSNITNNILSMVDPCKIRIDVSCASSIWKFGRSCQVETRNHNSTLPAHSLYFEEEQRTLESRRDFKYWSALLIEYFQYATNNFTVAYLEKTTWQ